MSVTFRWIAETYRVYDDGSGYSDTTGPRVTSGPWWDADTVDTVWEALTDFRQDHDIRHDLGDEVILIMDPTSRHTLWQDGTCEAFPETVTIPGRGKVKGSVRCYRYGVQATNNGDIDQLMAWLS